MSDTEAPAAHSFFSLTPDRVLDAVEGALDVATTGVRATGRSMPLNSIENRVYEIELDNESSVVAKFYRPDRWTEAQILEEHEFTRRLGESEVPVCAALPLAKSAHSKPIANGKNLATLARNADGIVFAVFPKVRGRILDELRDEQIEILGRLLARLHAVGAGYSARSKRLNLDIGTYGEEPIATLEESGFITSNMGERYRLVVEGVLDRIDPLLHGAFAHRIHGDCHLGNILWGVEGPFFVDFDDMVVGPPVQDIWMIVRGDDEEALRQRDRLVGAYREMREFDEATLDFIEPLRALRMIHYSAWIARRWDDPSFPRMFPTFGSDSWWQSEIEALHRLSEILENR